MPRYIAENPVRAICTMISHMRVPLEKKDVMYASVQVYLESLLAYLLNPQNTFIKHKVSSAENKLEQAYLGGVDVFRQERIRLEKTMEPDVAIEGITLILRSLPRLLVDSPGARQ